MERTFKNRILDKLFYHKYDWVTVKEKPLSELEQKCIEFKGVEFGYEVYKCLDIFSFPYKVIMYRKKGYNPEQHYSIQLNKQVAEYNAKTGSYINADTTNPWLLAAILTSNVSDLGYKRGNHI